jgi:hypothetical protein
MKPCFGQREKVTGGESKIRETVRHTNVNDKLDDLAPRDPFLPPDTHATSALEVVPVHDDMDG